MSSASAKNVRFATPIVDVHKFIYDETLPTKHSYIVGDRISIRQIKSYMRYKTHRLQKYCKCSFKLFVFAYFLFISTFVSICFLRFYNMIPFPHFEREISLRAFIPFLYIFLISLGLTIGVILFIYLYSILKAKLRINRIRKKRQSKPEFTIKAVVAVSSVPTDVVSETSEATPDCDFQAMI